MTHASRLFTEREQFLAERRTCIGSSDAASLFNEGYGCLRRLFYSKRGVPPDFSIDDYPIIRRGVKLEAVAAEEYAADSGRQIHTVGLMRHPEHPELGSHIDRWQEAQERSDSGAVEIKCLGRESFSRTKRQGISIDYTLQLQHHMLVSGAAWGTFVVFWPDGFQLLWWDVERDNELCEMIRQSAVAIWPQIQAGVEWPERLPVEDKRCASCQWKRTCQEARLLELAGNEDASGIEFDAELAALAAEYDEARTVAVEADEIKEEAAARLKTALGDRQAIDTNGFRIYFRVTERRSLDTTRLKKEHPDLARQYEKSTAVRALRLYAKGES